MCLVLCHHIKDMVIKGLLLFTGTMLFCETRGTPRVSPFNFRLFMDALLEFVLIRVQEITELHFRSDGLTM